MNAYALPLSLLAKPIVPALLAGALLVLSAFAVFEAVFGDGSQ